MNNNKQSSVEWYAIEMAEYLRSIYGDGIVNIDILKQAKAMHKEEVIEAYNESFRLRDKPYSTAIKYYNETFGGNNEEL